MNNQDKYSRFEINKRTAGEKAKYADEFITLSQIEVTNYDFGYRGAKAYYRDGQGFFQEQNIVVPPSKPQQQYNLVINYSKGNLIERLVYEFLTPVTEWVIDHNQGVIPDVQTTDLQDNVLWGYVDHINHNRLIIRFNIPVSGRAYLYL